MKGGGKSRKSGGVSKKLIAKLKSEYSTNSSKSSCGKKKDDAKANDSRLFDFGGKTKD
jgi:hypothetical protein